MIVRQTTTFECDICFDITEASVEYYRDAEGHPHPLPNAFLPIGWKQISTSLTKDRLICSEHTVNIK